MEQLFSIVGFTEEKARRISRFDYEPHVHDFEELVVCKSGVIEHLIGLEFSRLTAPMVGFISQGKVHTIKMMEDRLGRFPEGWILRFKSAFIPESRFQMYSDYHDHANLELPVGKHFDRICVVAGMIEEECLGETPDYSVIRSLLSSLLVIIESERKKISSNPVGTDKNQNTTFKAFLRILEDNFRRNVNVDFYAEKLNMSSRNLNLICREILQRSVSEIIETRKLTEAKIMLLHTDKSISEIGYELGYNEKAYFTKVFKKKAGITPSEYRNDMRKML